MTTAGKAINDGVDAIKNGVSDAAIVVNEFWNNKIYGVNTDLYSKDSFSVYAHSGGGIIVLNEDINRNLTGRSLNISQNIPYTNYSVGFSLSGKNSNINTWKTKNYVKANKLDGKTSYSLGYGFNKEGYYTNQTMSGGTDKLPLVLPNGVKIDSNTNVTWSISQDETIVLWETA